MLLILEIWLTAAAWRKGWKAMALLPMGIVLVTCLCIGLAVGAAGGNVDAAMGVAVVVELMGIVALAVMASVKPQQVQPAPTFHSAAPGDASPGEDVLSQCSEPRSS